MRRSFESDSPTFANATDGIKRIKNSIGKIEFGGFYEMRRAFMSNLELQSFEFSIVVFNVAVKLTTLGDKPFAFNGSGGVAFMNSRLFN